MKRLTKREKMDVAFDKQIGDMKAAEAQGMSLAEYHAKPLTEIIGDGLDAAVDGRGFSAEHQKAFDLANAAPAMLDAINEADVAFACINICDDLTPQARGALKTAWAKVQAAILVIRPQSLVATLDFRQATTQKIDP